MKAATLSQSTSRIPQPALYPLEGLTKTSTRKTAVLVGLCFLVATFTFAIGSALIHSHFSSGTSRDGTLVAGVLLLACTGLAAVTNGLAMRSVLTPHTRLRSQAYLILRAVECLTIVAIGGYFLTSRTQWNASVLPVYAVSGAAGLILSSALWTSWLVPRNVSMLGLNRLPGVLGRHGPGHVQPDPRHSRRRDARAGPRWPLRVDPPDLAGRQRIRLPAHHTMIPAEANIRHQ